MRELYSFPEGMGAEQRDRAGIVFQIIHGGFKSPSSLRMNHQSWLSSPVRWYRAPELILLQENYTEALGLLMGDFPLLLQFRNLWPLKIAAQRPSTFGLWGAFMSRPH